MLENLIATGKAFVSEAIEGYNGIKYFDSVNYEKWISKSLLYIEQNYPNSTLTDKAKEGYKEVDQRNSYDYFQFLLGTLMGIKEYEDEIDKSI